MAGIDDVAQAAGVSTATVSRALRGLPNVSASTRARVRAEAERLGYVPSPSAASLATGRTRTIGVITPWVNRWFFANVIEGAERALRSVGYDVLLYTFEVDDGRPRRKVDPTVLRRRVDGTLVVGLPLEDDEVASLVALGTPLAFVGSGPADQVTVRLDDVRTGSLATRHLLDLGHRVVGHITGQPDLVSSWSPPVERSTGYERALRKAGIEPSPDLVVNGGFDVAGGRSSTKELLRRRPDVTAIFAASDEMAMGAILAARDLGLDVPGDLSVVGVDGHDLGELVGLTTIGQDAYQQGADASMLLMEMINGAPVPESLTYPTHLVRRSSTSQPRRR
ncbi:LacI family DNA-binding transcriptional regulator [Oerskovia sp. NPDC057915]|uniref:LacI family DNA-binding transcriptional regulator n=1 Tax=Oerskovia sp. NPDC057915 TaxID=3346280 RepID=UPI0036DD69B5